MHNEINQREVDRLFEQANSIIASLPKVRDPESFYDLVDVSTPVRRGKWEWGWIPAPSAEATAFKQT
jgi:hypothetical protein